MSLYWPPFPVSPDAAPRLHALVVGVGDYPHLDVNATRPAQLLNGLQPLTTTPLAAKSIARWLEQEYHNDDCPLGSIELLLSPAETMARGSAADVAVEAATMANVKAAFDRWFARCDADKRNIAFFYFAGHGVSNVRQFLLAGDFGNPAQPNGWENCVDFTGMKAGMSKCAAQTQVFFVDACRDTPVAVLLQRNPNGNPLVTSTFQDRVDVSAAYYAASEGKHAYGPDNAETYFCQALLTCLRGAAARRVNSRWRVDTAVLSSALSAVISNMATAYRLPLDNDCQAQKPVALHYPGEGSAQAERESSIHVVQGNLVLDSPVGDPRPLLRPIKTGDAQLDVTFSSYAAERRSETVMPPTWEVDIDR